MDVWPPKDPQDVLDYTVDWQDATNPTLLPGETIVTSTFTVVSGTVTLGTGGQAPTATSTIAKMWLLGGTLDEVCEIRNHIVTSAGREYDKTTKIRIKAH